MRGKTSAPKATVAAHSTAAIAPRALIGISLERYKGFTGGAVKYSDEKTNVSTVVKCVHPIRRDAGHCSSSSNLLAATRSGVSKPSVNQP